MDLYMKERRKTQCRLPKPEPNAEYQCRAVLLAMGAGEADRGKRGRQGQARSMGASEAGGGRRDRWGQARLVGAGEANGGRKPPGQIPSQQQDDTTPGTGSNSAAPNSWTSWNPGRSLGSQQGGTAAGNDEWMQEREQK